MAAPFEGELAAVDLVDGRTAVLVPLFGGRVRLCVRSTHDLIGYDDLW